MWPVSARWDPAIRSSYRPAVRATVYPPEGDPFEVPLVSWSVTADRTANVRRTLQCTLAPGVARGLAGVTVVGGYLQLDVGIDYMDGSVELIPQGRFRLDGESAQLPTGGLELQGFGHEKAVADDRFLQPRTERNSSALDLITRLIRETIPDAVVDRRTDRDAQVTSTTWEKERWDAIDGADASLARAIGVEVWADGRGRFVISAVPSLADPPVWRVDAGLGGVLITAASTTSTDGVYNAVVATGDASDGTVPVGPVIVQDTDPTSPTRVDGPFGRRVRYYSSPLLKSPGQAGDAARSILANSLGLTASLSFTALPNPALEPGDVVLVDSGSQTPELHLIDKVSLSSSGAMSCQTRSTKEAT